MKLVVEYETISGKTNTIEFDSVSKFKKAAREVLNKGVYKGKLLKRNYVQVGSDSCMYMQDVIRRINYLKMRGRRNANIGNSLGFPCNIYKFADTVGDSTVIKVIIYQSSTGYWIAAEGESIWWSGSRYGYDREKGWFLLRDGVGDNIYFNTYNDAVACANAVRGDLELVKHYGTSIHHRYEHY